MKEGLEVRPLLDAALVAGLVVVAMVFLDTFAPGRALVEPEAEISQHVRMAVVHSPECRLADRVHFIEGDGVSLEAGIVHPTEWWDEGEGLEHTEDPRWNVHSAAIRTPSGLITTTVRDWARARGWEVRRHRRPDGTGCPVVHAEEPAFSRGR